MRAGWTKALAAGALLTAGVASVEASGPNLYDYAAFGIDRTTGEVLLYSFNEKNEASRESLGQLKALGSALTGVQGATYVPGHARLFYAFWTNDDGQTYLVHVRPAGAETDELVAALRPIEGGRVTGAASFIDMDGSARTFILQRESTIPTYDIDGRINIDPNNKQHMRFEFERVTDDGTTLISIDRADLLEKDGIEDGEGNFVIFDDNAGEGGAYDYETHTTQIQVRPKGGQSQDEIDIVSDSGEEYELHNSNTYNLTGKLRVRIYNDDVDGDGKAMGRWWLELEGQAQFEHSEVGTLTRIAELDAVPLVPEVVEAAVLEEHVLENLGIDADNLIGLGARVNDAGEIETFVGDEHEVYRIQLVHDGTAFDADNPVIDSEPMVLPTSRDLISLDFAGAHLGGIDSYASGRIVVLDVDGADTLIHSTNKPGSETPGAITFMPVDTAETMARPNYD